MLISPTKSHTSGCSSSMIAQPASEGLHLFLEWGLASWPPIVWLALWQSSCPTRLNYTVPIILPQQAAVQAQQQRVWRSSVGEDLSSGKDNTSAIDWGGEHDRCTLLMRNAWPLLSRWEISPRRRWPPLFPTLRCIRRRCP